jgi:hypothetical protein
MPENLVTDRLEADGSQQAAAAPTPTLPLQASYTTVMGQDVVMTDTIPVDSTSPSPVGVFTNPASGGIAGNAQTEALTVVGGQVNHAARSADTDAGWQLTPLFGGRAANEVAAGTAYAASSSAAVYGHFSDDDGLYFTQLQADGVTWSSPQTLQTAPSSNAPSAANLRVAYSPAGRMVLYGNSAQGDLVTATQSEVGGPFVGTVTSMNGALGQGDFHLCMVNESSWTLAVNQGGQPWLYTGELGGSEYSSSEQASQFPGTLQTVVLGYWAASQNTLIFLFVDADSALHVWATNSASSTTVARPVPNSKVTTAVGHVATDSTLHVYSLDDSQGLWVLHQDPDTPWNDDGTPNWSPYIPLDASVGGLASDTTPADAPRMFALDAADYSLRFHAQDANTGMWRAGKVLQASSSAQQVTRFRTEISVTDAYGLPVPNYPITLQSASGFSAADLWIAAKTYHVDSQTPVNVTTDALGKATIAILTTAGLATPQLSLSADGLTPVTVQPAGGIHTYLSGQGTLNPTNNPANSSGPLPVFDANGDTLTAATVDQQPLANGVQNNPSLAATAAQGIRNAASIAVGQAPAGVVGFHLSLTDPSGPSFTVLNTREELDAQVALHREGSVGSIWDDVTGWAGDVWEGIKNGAIEIQAITVSAADQLATFTAKIGNYIVRGVQIAIKNLEQAAHFIAGVFQSILADIELVIEWLMALFDFKAIWHTKMAFEQALTTIPKTIEQLTSLAATYTDGWFSAQQQTIDSAFAAVAENENFKGKSFSDLPSWPAGSGSWSVAGATIADFTSNVHHNWLFNKVISYVSSGPNLPPGAMDSDPWNTFVTQAQAGSTDFVNALKTFASGAEDLFKSPTTFAGESIPTFLGIIQDVADGVLSLADAIANAFFGIVDEAMNSLESLFTTELDLGFLNTLWSWIADLAGYPDDDKLTVAALIALLAAVPCTVIYKLIIGASEEPFPTGALPTPPTGALLAGMPPTSEPAVLSAAILLMLEYPFAVCSDIFGIIGAANGQGDPTPWYVSLLMIGASAIMVSLPYLPDLSVLTGRQWSSVVELLICLAAVVTLVFLVIKTFAWDLATSLWENPATGDVINVLLSAVGLGKMTLGLVQTSFEADAGDLDVLTAGARLVLPLPLLFSFLKTTWFNADDPVAALADIAVKGVADDLGYLAGGSLEVIDAASEIWGGDNS